MADLIEKKLAVLNLVNPDYSFSQILAEPEISANEDVQLLSDALRNNPAIFLELDDPLIDELTSDGIRVITVSYDFEAYQDVTLNDCDTQFVILDIVKTAKAFILAPHIKQTEIDCLNSAIDDNIEELNHHLEQFLFEREKTYESCRHVKAVNNQRPIGSPLMLVRIGETFVILGVGLVLAAIWFVYENVRVGQILLYINRIWSLLHIQDRTTATVNNRQNLVITRL